MIQLPHNCRYYLDQSREYALKKDYVRSLRMLYLAQTYADNSDDEYECFAEKLNIFDALGADVLAVCYESIAKQAFGEEMYAVLVNNAVAHKDADQAAYYLDLYNSEGEDDIPRITPSDAREEEGGAAGVPMEKLIADADGVSPIRAVDAEEEYINGELKKVMAYALTGSVEPAMIKKLMELRSDNPKMEDRICQVLAQCADIVQEDASLEIYRSLVTRAAECPAVIFDGCISSSVRKDGELWRAYDKRLLEIVEKKELSVRDKRMAAFALVEHNHAEKALEVLEGCDVSLADIFARRIYISALLLTEGGEEEALAMLEDNLLLEDKDDRIVWEFYKRFGKTRCFEHYNCAFFSVKESVLNDAAAMKTNEIRELMQTTYGRFMFEEIARTASYRSIPMDEETMVAFICLYTDYQPEAALRLLYDHEISSRIKRTILHRFIYNNDVYDVKKYVFLTSVDRYVTVEDFGYIYRNDVIFGEEFDNWPERIRAAASTAVVDCCFYNNYGEGELFAAVKQVYEKMRKMRGICAFNTIYRAIVLTLNPNLEDFYNASGMTEKDKSKVLAVAKKFGIKLED